MSNYIEMTMEEWEATYKPITNHIDENASFQNEDDEGIMFETYGEELSFVRDQDIKYIWTYHHGESNSSFISNGYGIINRLGYFITEVPCPDDTDVYVVVQEENYMCENCEEQWYGDAADLHWEQFGDLGKCAKCATMEEIKEIEREYSANI